MGLLTVRATDDEIAQVKANAAAAGFKTYSAWIRVLTGLDDVAGEVAESPTREGGGLDGDVRSQAVAGEPAPCAPPPPDPLDRVVPAAQAKVVDLMAALEASVAEAKAARDRRRAERGGVNDG